MRNFLNRFLMGLVIVCLSALVFLMFYVPETTLNKPATLKDLVAFGLIFWVMTASVVMVFSYDPKNKY